MGRRGWGRAVLATCAAGLLVGVGAAASRVSDAEGAREVQLPGDFLPPDTYPRLDRAAPALSLIDQTGERFSLDDLRGRPALVTFAFGNCHTVCPVVVRQALDVRRTLAESAAAGEVSSEAVPNVVIVSLDPWRDTPARLTHLAEHWELDGSSRVLTGSVGEVEAVLTAWNVARQRDPSTGDITHPPLVYLLDASGQIAYASTGGTASMVELVKRM
jgi:protein SCO1/2